MPDGYFEPRFMPFVSSLEMDKDDCRPHMLGPITSYRLFIDGKQLLTAPAVLSVSYDDRKTTIRWADGTKTTVVCGQGEPFDKYTGFMAAVCKKLFGSTSAAKKLRSRLDEDNIKAERIAAQQKAEAEASEKRKRRENRYIKRRAKEIVLEERARSLAVEIINKEYHL